MKKVLLIATVIAGTLSAGTAAFAGDYRHGPGHQAAPAAQLLYHYLHPRHQIVRYAAPRRHYYRHGRSYRQGGHYRHGRQQRWAPRHHFRNTYRTQRHEGRQRTDRAGGPNRRNR